MTDLAIYDMDKTITRLPTFAPFLIHAVRTREPWRSILAPVALVTIFLYLVRAIDRARLKELNHRLLLGPHVPANEAAQLARTFAAKTLADNILPLALDRMAADRTQGRRLVLATASYAFYAHEIGEALGFDDVIGTNCATDADGALLAKIDGENCYGPAKLRMIEAWMAREGLGRGQCDIRFYSDHVSDAPCLEWADEAVAVNAHAPLATLAAARGWRREEWG